MDIPENLIPIKRECPACHGTGQVVDSMDYGGNTIPCPFCDGGFIYEANDSEDPDAPMIW